MTSTVLHPAPLPAVVGPSIGPCLGEIEAWLVDVRPPLGVLRDGGRPPSAGARRWLLEVVAEAERALASTDHACAEALAHGTSVDDVEWLHTRVSAVVDVGHAVLARTVRVAQAA